MDVEPGRQLAIIGGAARQRPAPTAAAGGKLVTSSSKNATQHDHHSFTGSLMDGTADHNRDSHTPPRRYLPSPHSIDTKAHSIPSSPVPRALSLLKAPSPLVAGSQSNTQNTNVITSIYVDPIVHRKAEAQAVQSRWRDSLLRKFGIALKDKEIQKLRTTLAIEREHTEKVETRVATLQGALKETLVYATKADEWQVKEAGRLSVDVDSLKEQVAALMVMFIHAEEERAKVFQFSFAHIVLSLTIDYSDLRTLQDKLQECYREYLEMHATIERLEHEAIEGSGAARTRAEVLSQHLDRMSRDFDTTSRSLIAAQERGRQLEFELGALITQFNETGDARHALQKAYDEVSDRFAELDARHMQLCSVHEEDVATIKLLKEQLDNEKRENAEAKAERDAELHVVQHKLEEMTGAKAQVEGIVARLKGESEKLRASVIELRSAKSDLETQVAKLQQSYDSDVAQLRTKCEEASSGTDKLVSDLAKVTDQRERLQVQVNDLRSVMEREKFRATTLDTELKALKASSAASQQELEAQVAQLTVAKNNLTSDKKELMETLSKARRDLIEKKVAFEDLEAKTEEWTAAKTEEVAGLQANIASLQDQLAKMTSQYTQLAGNHRSLKQKHEDTEKEFGKAQGVIHDRDESLAKAHAKIRDLEDMQTRLEMNLKGEHETVDQLTATIKNLEKQIIDINTEFNLARDDWKRRESNHDERRRMLETNLNNLREQYRVLSLTHDQALAAHQRTKQDLNRTRDAVLEESAARSLLEMAVDDLRGRYDGEKRARADYERLGYRLEKKVSGWVGSKLDAWIDRERAWTELEEWMKNEVGRLDDMIGILGLEDGLPDEDIGRGGGGGGGGYLGASISRSPSGYVRSGGFGGLSRSRTSSAKSTRSTRNLSRDGSAAGGRKAGIRGKAH
ncbi:hypothetical protein BCR44DRAFT_1514815 [Catenaria anguillulae PL171]|uniref:Uncharacterized protein n=1 Tax=Catenaria anguillulae PL171 TaxID=765915 RepID=A0A1Y2HFR6_9FUNG|nr:hypothetical protein BCR44DRAFT_1514815 [Catenaria anguillulae PL171]